MTVHRSQSDVMLWQPSRRPHQRGFTLIELIMVIVMLGVLAVFAAPRMFNSSDFYARGFHDETLALLRYAQKTAIAQRRTVCVAMVMGSATPPPMASGTLTIASTAGDASCGPNLTGPTGQSPATVTARSGVYFSVPTGLSTTFSFNGLGQPSAGQKFQVGTLSGTAGSPIIVEAETGYVHD